MQERFSRFRIIKELGRGGMGVVFEAEDPHLQRTIALKVMRSESAKRADARERFLREARAMAALKHDHVVTVHDVGEDAGIPFIAMELLKGASLEAVLQRNSEISIPALLKFGTQIAKGLEAAHAVGLVHRDIKPGNVWLEAESHRVKILDFGLARILTQGTPQLTQAGTVVGTPSYMAPEQARGESADNRCDLFSLGCILYRVATGRLPFSGDNAIAVITAIVTETPPSPGSVNPRVPAQLSHLIERLLEKRPDDRPASARTVIEELALIRSALTSETKSLQSMQTKALPTQDLPAAASPPLPAPRRRSPFWVFGGAVLAMIAVTASVPAFRNAPEEEFDHNGPPDRTGSNEDRQQQPEAQPVPSFVGVWIITSGNRSRSFVAMDHGLFVGTNKFRGTWEQKGKRITIVGKGKMIGKKSRKTPRNHTWVGNLEPDGNSITLTVNGVSFKAVRKK